MKLALQCAAGIAVVIAMMLAFSLYLQYDDYRRREAAASADCLRAEYWPVLAKGKWVPGVRCTEVVDTRNGEVTQTKGDKS